MLNIGWRRRWIKAERRFTFVELLAARSRLFSTAPVVVVFLFEVVIGNVSRQFSAACITRLLEHARSYTNGSVVCCLFHMYRALDELLTHAMFWELLDSDAVALYVGESTVDLHAKAQELFVYFPLDWEDLRLGYLLDGLSKDGNEMLEEVVHGGWK